jgi:hypothetical protein
MTQLQVRLGKDAAVSDSRTLRFSAYFGHGPPVAPVSVDWGDKVHVWPMYLNDKYADCTSAAAAHMVQAWTASAGHETAPSDAAVLDFYRHFTVPGANNGCSALDALKYWRNQGLGGDRILAFTQLDLRNIQAVKDTIALFGGCYLGLILPKFAVVAADRAAVPWTTRAGSRTGNAAPDPRGGHCIAAVGYDADNVYAISWGRRKLMSWQFYVDYADEAFAVLSPQFLKHNTAANGINLAQLMLDLRKVAQIPAEKATISRSRRPRRAYPGP